MENKKVLEKGEYVVRFNVKNNEMISDGKITVEVIEDGYTESDLIANVERDLYEDMELDIEVLDCTKKECPDGKENTNGK